MYRCVYYGSPSYKGLLGVFCVRYMLRKKKVLGIKHGCQGYQVGLTRDENIWRTWLRNKIIMRGGGRRTREITAPKHNK